MNIGFDARYLSHALVGGVHGYVQHLLPALIDAATQHTICVFADAKHPFELDTGQWPARATLTVLPYQNGISSIQHDLFLGHAMARAGVDVAHFPANVGMTPASLRTVLTLHDEINILPLTEIWRGHRKSARTMAMMTYLHAMSSMSVRKAALIVTSSEYARRRIVEVGRLDPARVRVVPLAPNPQFARMEDAAVLADARARHGLPEHFVLADALKNPAVLVRAWRMLTAELRENRKIVFFARRPDVLPVIHDAVAAGDALLLQRPSYQDLTALYSIADAFVFPSWIEGFGLPVLEAMACGAPVIASNRGSIPEVAGDAALLADAEDAAGFAAHLQRVLSDTQYAVTLQRRGFVRVTKFTWPRTAEMLLNIYTAAMTGGDRALAGTAHVGLP
jgi:hypothetical protein